jgi:hypothetical protein
MIILIRVVLRLWKVLLLAEVCGFGLEQLGCEISGVGR